MSSRRTRYSTPRVCRRSRCQLVMDSLPYLSGSPGREGFKVTLTRPSSTLFRLRRCLRRCSFLRARAGENAGHRDVPFMTRILVQLSVGTLQTDHEGPRACPCGGIVNRQFPIDVVRAYSRVALSETHVGRGGHLKAGLKAAAVIRRFDDQRVLVPVTSRIAMQLTDARGQMREAAQRDETSVVDELLLNHDRLRGLGDLKVAVVSGKRPRRAIRNTTLGQRAILGTVSPTGRAALRSHALLHCLQKNGTPRFSVGCQRRKLTIRRVGDERRSVVPFPIAHPELVVVAGGRVVRQLVVLAAALRIE